jgi:hypothetical protein
VAEVEPTPAGLAAPGRRLWQRVTEKYVLTATELAILEQICHTADELARLERAARRLRTLDLVVEGSTGQLKTHPLFDQLLRQRVVLGKLVEQLGLPDESTLPKPKVVPSRGPHGGTMRATS